MYVRGWFRTSRRRNHRLDRMHSIVREWLANPERFRELDIDKDGAISDAELALARSAALTHADAKPDTPVPTEDSIIVPSDGRPFIIRPQTERAHVYESRRKALLHLATGFLAFVFLLASLPGD